LVPVTAIRTDRRSIRIDRVSLEITVVEHIGACRIMSCGM
jgi:hypothetical protein